MVQVCDVVITGVGVVSPLGIGREPFWESLINGQSGVRTLDIFQQSAFPFHFGAEVSDFEAKKHVRARKSIKLMSRPIQMAYAAADLAMQDASLPTDSHKPDRLGVVFGSEMFYCDYGDFEEVYPHFLAQQPTDFNNWAPQAMSDMNPLWLLKYLPNMAACHIGIAHDARGPNNTIAVGDTSSLLAVKEGQAVIERGWADLMVVGGVGQRMHPTPMVYRGARSVSCRNEAPERASRPFDADRNGMVVGEGSAAFILESRQHAEQRGAKIFASLLSCSSTFEPAGKGRTGVATRNSINQALQAAAVDVSEVGHVNAHGLSTIEEDRLEAQAIQTVLGDVPVTAPKSFFGNLGTGSGAVEMAVSVLALESGTVPQTLNYETPDPACPLNVIHGEALKTDKRAAVVLNQSTTGQAAALVLAVT